MRSEENTVLGVALACILALCALIFFVVKQQHSREDTLARDGWTKGECRDVGAPIYVKAGTVYIPLQPSECEWSHETQGKRWIRE